MAPQSSNESANEAPNMSNPVTYTEKQDFYQTNPIAAICDFYNIDWDAVCWMTWHVEYEKTINRTIENRDGEWISINLYRRPTGTYEAVTYNAGK